MESLSAEEKIERQTLKFLQNVQQTLGRGRNGKIGAYYRWHEQNLLEQSDERLAITASTCNHNTAATASPSKATTKAPTISPQHRLVTQQRLHRQQHSKRLPNVDSLCSHCLTPFAQIRVVPKKTQLSAKQNRKGNQKDSQKKAKRPTKRGNNFNETLITAKCQHCLSTFKFAGFQAKNSANKKQQKAVFKKEKKPKDHKKKTVDNKETVVERTPTESAQKEAQKATISTPISTPQTSSKQSFKSPLLSTNKTLTKAFKSPLISNSKSP